MDKILIRGQVRLSGDVEVNGAKNAVVAIIPAALLADDICIIENLPCIEDVASLVDTIQKIGCKCEFLDKHTLSIDSRGVHTLSASYESVKKLRASYYLMGALLGRYKKAEVALPGGCDFGTRPIDQHMKGFEQLGARVSIERGMVHLEAEKLVGTNVYLDVVSVGATINIMLAAVLAEGQTVIENAAKEPHVVDTANFLNSMGANIKGAGTDMVRIKGVDKLHGTRYAIIPDQIEAGTFMIAAAITGGDVNIKGIIPKHMDSVSAKLYEMGVEITEYDDAIRVLARKKLRNISIKTMPYPGFPTDLQPQMASLLSVCEGTSFITENVWENRYKYVNELMRLGANITVEGRIAVVEGVPLLMGAEVQATDLRAGAALIVAGLGAAGTTTIGNVKYIYRGYENIVEKLTGLGADISRIAVEEE